MATTNNNRESLQERIDRHNILQRAMSRFEARSKQQAQVIESNKAGNLKAPYGDLVGWNNGSNEAARLRNEYVQKAVRLGRMFRRNETVTNDGTVTERLRRMYKKYCDAVSVLSTEEKEQVNIQLKNLR